MNTSLIIVDHGSKREAANQMLEQVVQLVAQMAPEGRFLSVEPAHMELAPPTLQSAIDRCVDAGAQRIIISLFFLSPGRHATNDIPRMLQENIQRHPDVEFQLSDPLGVDERIASLLLSRAEEATPLP